MTGKTSTPHFDSFPALIEQHFLPHRQAHPDDERLDGLSGKGNVGVFATFDHQGQTWKIHLDAKTDRLQAAWNLHQDGKEPFIRRETKTGFCLRLDDGQPDLARGLYIYAVGK